MKRVMEVQVSRAKQNFTEDANEVREKIRLRAYELYEQRGREEGHDFEDWLQAESEVLSKPIAA
jgi:hypothetical protein